MKQKFVYNNNSPSFITNTIEENADTHFLEARKDFYLVRPVMVSYT